MQLSSSIFDRLKYFVEPELQNEILKHGKIMHAKPGDVLIREGQYLNFLPIVLTGLLRVYQEKDDREILLYYVGPEQTCMMSLSSAFFDYSSAANGKAVEETDILVLPAMVIGDWQLRFPSWNRYIISTFKARYDELLNAFADVVFKPINIRVHEYLSQYVSLQKTSEVPISHQELANELGTTRVVISRILKQMEKDNMLKLKRGSISVMQA